MTEDFRAARATAKRVVTQWSDTISVERPLDIDLSEYDELAVKTAAGGLWVMAGLIALVAVAVIVVAVAGPAIAAVLR